MPRGLRIGWIFFFLLEAQKISSVYIDGNKKQSKNLERLVHVRARGVLTS